MDLLLSARPGQGCTVLEVHGDLDMATEPQLRDALQPLIGSGPVVIDLTGVAFMDSSALGTLVVMYKMMLENGGRLCLAGVQQTVRTVLRVTSVDRAIDVYGTVQAAEESFIPTGQGSAG